MVYNFNDFHSFQVEPFLDGIEKIKVVIACEGGDIE